MKDRSKRQCCGNWIGTFHWAFLQPRLGVIKDENGRVLTEAGEIVDRWKRYCEGMYTSDAPTTAVQRVRLEDTEQEEETCLPPLKSEVEWAIKSL